MSAGASPRSGCTGRAATTAVAGGGGACVGRWECRVSCSGFRARLGWGSPREGRECCRLGPARVGGSFSWEQARSVSVSVSCQGSGQPGLQELPGLLPGKVKALLGCQRGCVGGQWGREWLQSTTHL